MGFDIRPARGGDLGSLLGILALLHDRLGLGEGPELAAAPVWESMLRQQGRTVLVADDHGTLVGTADLLVVPNLTHGARAWAIVENVVVTPVRRRQGIGRALMQEVIKRATEANCYKLQLLSRQERTEAHAFYRSLGLERVAEGFRLYL